MNLQKKLKKLRKHKKAAIFCRFYFANLNISLGYFCSVN